MTILASLAPIALYLVVLKAMDAFSFARWRNLFTCFLWGIAAVGIVFCLSQGWRILHSGEPWHALWISPLIEETIKVVPLLYLISRNRIVFLAEALIYGQMVGGGFATAENILYLSGSSQMLLGTAIVRGFSTSMLHMGCTSLVAAFSLYPLLRFAREEKTFARAIDIIGVIPALLPSVGIHFLYNMQMLPPMIQLVLVVVCFLLLFLFLEKFNERVVAKWLDLSLNNHIKLLSDLREGTFADSPTGKYLISIREKFEPLVFFDLCAFLTLCLELIVAAKSQVMLREAGLDCNSTEEEKKTYREKITELKSLSRNIPRLGHILIRPILNISTEDKWAIRMLGK